MRHHLTGYCLALLCVLIAADRAAGADIVLNDYGYEMVLATGLDQPRVTCVLTDAGDVIEEDGIPVVFNAYADTGASGLVISNLNAVGHPGTMLSPPVQSLGLDGLPEGEFLGPFTETGVGGTEVGDVTRSFGVRVRNGSIGEVDGSNYAEVASEFVDYGGQNLWVRRAPGVGEIANVLGMELVDPVNIVGMPVLGQRVMVMDPTPVAELMLMGTYLLPPGDPGIPQDTNVTFDIRMDSFIGDPPPGEVLPSHADNPMVLGIDISNTPVGGVTQTLTEQEWLFDTGAGSSFIGLEQAWALGIIPDGMSLEDFALLHGASGGIVLPIGGIGDPVDAPLVTVDEIRIQRAGDSDGIVWQNVDILIIDVPGLAGVFGMNLLMPSATIDPDDPLGSLDLVSPGYFNAMVFDPFAGELRLRLDIDPEISADANGDGFVTDADYTVWADNYGQEAWGPSEGDFNGDGRVTDADYTMWADSYGGSPGSVPEPASSLLILLGATMIAGANRHARSRVENH
jgi:hypothetical protein